MKTDDMIKALVADNPVVSRPIGRTIALWLAVGAVVGSAVFMALAGVRADFGYQITHSWEFVLKFVFTLAVLIPALALVRRLARPEGDASGLAIWLILPVAIMLAAMGYDMATAGAAHATSMVFLPNWSKCVVLIPILSLAPLAAVLTALKQGAPAHPALAGAVGGLLSGAMGATLYASHCDADSPLFVGVWYPLGIVAVTALGGLIGSRLLKW
ncbi:MAG: NrsF family protein [Hyphomicrobium sp.]